ncbi:hypothetical protein MY4038_004350 [Beauveria bassiana]
MSVCVYFADDNFRLSHALEFAPDGVMWVESFMSVSRPQKQTAQRIRARS